MSIYKKICNRNLFIFHTILTCPTLSQRFLEFPPTGRHETIRIKEETMNLLIILSVKITGAQLRHIGFRIFADPSRIFTYNCDKTFKTTSRTLSENMPGHA